MHYFKYLVQKKQLRILLFSAGICYALFKILLLSMSFGQKHMNHHCIHAHNCTNPQHKKLQSSMKGGKQHNKSSGLLKLENNKKEDCQFIGGKGQKIRDNGYEEAKKQLNQKESQLKEMRQNFNVLQSKYDKLEQDNRHLYTQIQYYRKQFASLITSNNADNKNQIKKRLNETNDLSLKVRSLQNQNLRLINQNETLKQSINDDKVNRVLHKQINDSLQDKYNSLHAKLTHLDREKEQYKTNSQTRLKEIKRYQQKYNILKQELGLECQRYKRQIKQLNAQLDNARKQLKALKNTLKKQRQLTKIQRDKAQSKENILKTKLTQCQNQNKQLTLKAKQLTQKCENLQQDLSHAKKMFQKKGQASKQFKQLERQISDKAVEPKTIIKERPVANTDNKQNQKSSQQSQKLKKQIVALKKKIQQLQQRTTSHFQEVIMNIGASEAFKKLLLEKNQIIKKLMREKGEIYSSIINSKS